MLTYIKHDNDWKIPLGKVYGNLQKSLLQFKVFYLVIDCVVCKGRGFLRIGQSYL